MLARLKAFIGKQILHYLNQVSGKYEPFSSVKPEVFEKCLLPGDVILIDGNSRIASIIRYLTQSTWSHAALFVGGALGPSDAKPEPDVLIEALGEHGVIASPLSKYARFNKRICRPVSLSPEDRDKVIAYAVNSIGTQYAVRHIVDLARYLMPYVPVPVSVRRRLLAFGSGEPTRAICFHFARQCVPLSTLSDSAENRSDDAARTRKRPTKSRLKCTRRFCTSGMLASSRRATSTSRRTSPS